MTDRFMDQLAVARASRTDEENRLEEALQESRRREKRWKDACLVYAHLEDAITLYDTKEKSPKWFAFCRVHDRVVDAMREGNLEELEAVLGDLPTELCVR